METIRVLVVDDHQLFRDGVRALLLATQDVELVGEATNGEDAIKLAEELQPDVVLMDIHMEGINGIETTRQIVQTTPHIGVLMITMHDDDHIIFGAMRAGARGYLLKGASHEEVQRAIRAVGHGEAIFSAPIATRMITFFNTMHTDAAPQAFPELTDREQEILDLIAQGYSNPEIAQALTISSKTVRNHVSNVFSKMQVADRAEAMLKARNAGMG